MGSRKKTRLVQSVRFVTGLRWTNGQRSIAPPATRASHLAHLGIRHVGLRARSNQPRFMNICPLSSIAGTTAPKASAYPQNRLQKFSTGMPM